MRERERGGGEEGGGERERERGRDVGERGGEMGVRVMGGVKRVWRERRDKGASYAYK